MYKVNAGTAKMRLKRNLWLDKLYAREMKTPDESYFSVCHILHCNDLTIYFSLCP